MIFFEFLSCKITRWITTIKQPRFLVNFMINLFIKKYKININEASKSIDEYSCLLDFFIRIPNENARPIDKTINSFVSPVDARISAMGTLNKNEILLVKNTPYTIEQLTGKIYQNYIDKKYIMLYLSPADFHRIYAPDTCKIIQSYEIKGRLRPVFEKSVIKHPFTFIENYRIVTEIETNNGKVLLIKVGALNVGTIKTLYPISFDQSATQKYNRGEEFARFEFGSTVIMLLENEKFEFDNSLKLETKIKIGERLGRSN